MRTLALLTLILLAGCSTMQRIEEARRVSMCAAERAYEATGSLPASCSAFAGVGGDGLNGDVICRKEDGSVAFEAPAKELAKSCPVSAMADYPR
jgi:hypothetical protein